MIGAATLPPARGRGVYGALLRHRLARVREQGASAAVIQADAATSAPICRRAGFMELCRLSFWIARGVTLRG
jgi:GNAT superfamily N-acetyltransferase